MSKLQNDGSAATASSGSPAVLLEENVTATPLTPGKDCGKWFAVIQPYNRAHHRYILIPIATHLNQAPDVGVRAGPLGHCPCRGLHEKHDATG